MNRNDATSVLIGLLVGGFLAISFPLGILWLLAVPLALALLVIASRSRLLSLATALVALGIVWMVWVRPTFIATCESDDCNYSTLLMLAFGSLAIGGLLGALWLLLRVTSRSRVDPEAN